MRFLSSFFNPAPPVTAANLSTPDEIIAAGVLESIKKDFADWKLTDTSGRGVVDAIPFTYAQKKEAKHTVVSLDGAKTVGLILERKRIAGKFAKHLTVKFTYFFKKGYYDSVVREVQAISLFVNEVRVDPAKVGFDLFKTYYALLNAEREAKRIAAEALANMQANEAKWNLAEGILGMRRNEQGALVPIEKKIEPATSTGDVGEPEEHKCDCDFLETCKYCG